MDPVFALSISGPLTDIGAVAGLVAIPGLAVLSLLYFAQAREVKRLREWAGRAPERAQELQDRVAEQAGRTGTIPPQPARRVVAQPAAQPGAGRPAGSTPATPAAAPSAKPAGVPAQPGAGQQPAAKPGAQPAPAGAPAASANPATAGAATTAKPEAKPASPGVKPDGKPATPPAATPGGGTPKPASPAVPAAGTAAAAARGNASGGTAPPATERPPARPAAAPGGESAAAARPPARRAQPLRSSRQSASPPAAARTPRGGIRGRLGRRGAAIVSGVLLVLVIGALVIVTQGGGGGSKAKPQAQNTLGPASQTTKPRTKPKSTAPSVQRGGTTVAVLNGTTTPGLAATVSDQLSRGGFKRGNVTNAADQQQSTTAVLYAPGYKGAADEIAQLLKLKSVQPIDAGTQAIAGSDAHIVVMVGTDRTQ
jgi:hypothetical protein